MADLRAILPAVAASFVVGLVLSPTISTTEPTSMPEAGSSQSSPTDFNGDGFGDLAIGIPGETVGGRADAGGVGVIYGSASGLHSAGNQFWTQNSAGIPGGAELADEFGFSVAAGDINGDGFSDTAVGVPLEDWHAEDAGAVNVMYGSAAGLTSEGSQVWSQDSPGVLGGQEQGDQFGRSLALGDFNGDGFADLAVGVPFEAIRSGDQAGAVNVLYGSASGLTAAGNQLWHQDSRGMGGTAEAGDFFGFALAAADFNDDTFVDLAVGVPGEDPPVDAGSVHIIYGSPNGLTSAGDRIWTQRSNGIGGAAEKGDMFGYSLASGDLNGDGFADLAVGVPFEAIGSDHRAGAVNVIYGSPSGLIAAGNHVWHQDSGAIRDTAEPYDEFAFALASGDFNGDGFWDLAAGVPGEGPPTKMGAANVIYGSAGGLRSAGNQIWSQDSPGIQGTGEAFDLLAFSLVAADFGLSPEMDLVLGVPFEDVSGATDAGAVSVIYGSPDGLSATGNRIWHQDSAGIRDAAEPGDMFAFALGAARLGAGPTP
ncbi:MAG: hypothetical protein ACRDGU_04435 [Actinomycetota bacterium]